MAVITFPRTQPKELTIAGASFVLEPMIEITPLRSGLQLAADLGPSLWRTEVKSTSLRGANFGIVRAWFDTLSSLKDFYGYDRGRQYPVSYTSWAGLTVSASPFDGTCQIATVETNAVEINLKLLPIGFKLRPGDYLSFDYSSGASRALHRIVAGGDAGGGGLLTVEVRPQVRVGWAANAVVTLYRAAARMKIIPGSYREDVRFLGGVGDVSFQAIQTL